MKRLYTTFVAVLAITQFSNAQWTGGPTGSVYYMGGNVGIGTTGAAGTGKFSVKDVGTSLEFDTDANSGAILSYDRTNSLYKSFLLRGASFNFLINDVQKVKIDAAGNVGIGTATPTANLEVNTNAIIGAGGNKLNTALTLVKNGDIYGTDNPMLMLKHSGNGVNWFPNPASDLGILQISGFNPGFRNKAINSQNNFFVYTDGTVGINTTYTSDDYKLAVNGGVIATLVRVNLANAWPDYVFNANYNLRSLSRVEDYVKQHHHLPDVPSAAEVEKKGVNLGETSSLLLKKIEELTLYLIEKDKQLKKQQDKIAALEDQRKEIDELKAQMAKLLK